MASSNNHQQDEQDMRTALQYDVAQICLEEAEDGAKITTAAVETLRELAFLYATKCLGPDLQHFSEHAKQRRTITVDDVLLVARKNPNGLQTKLKDYAERHNLMVTGGATASGKPKAKRKKASSKTSPKAAAAAKQSSRFDFADNMDTEDEDEEEEPEQPARKVIAATAKALDWKMSSSSSSEGEDPFISKLAAQQKKRPVAVKKTVELLSDSDDDSF